MKCKDIIIRKADKSNIFVILNRQKYEQQISDILGDSSKFKRLQKDPIPNLKKKLNKLIDNVNAVPGSHHIDKLIGHFQPGYIYGNPKIHKNSENPKLRPIISNIGSPCYNVAQRLNQILKPYLPKQYMVESTNEFISIINTIRNAPMIASLDVESLFTNIPILETIEIILENTYNNSDLSPPSIPRKIMFELL